MPVINAVILEIEVWSDGTHYRFLLKDYHMDHADGRNTIKQRNDLIQVLKRLVPDVFIIVEDPSNCTSKDERVKAYFDSIPYKTFEEELRYNQKQRGTVNVFPGSREMIDKCMMPDYLTGLCENERIPCYNAECNHAIAAFFGTENIPHPVTKLDVINDLKQYVNECFVGEKRDDVYRVLDNFEREKFFVSFVEHIRSVLLDLRTMGKLAQCGDVKYGFVCEGADHINVVKTILQDLGYTHIKSYGKNPPDERLSLDQNLGDWYLENIVLNALDLRKTFTEIFAEQQSEVKPVSLWTSYKMPLATVATVVILGCVALQYWHK